MSKKLAIIDYGLGNLHSVAKAMKLAAPGWQVDFCSTPQQLLAADKLVFPGVGAIGDCMDGLQKLNLIEPLLEFVQNRHCLAICVGFQALFTRIKEFGDYQGLQLVEGDVCHINELARAQNVDMADMQLRVPHSGWNQLRLTDKYASHPVFSGIEQSPYVYFVHSYGVALQNQSYCAASVNHGIDLVAMLVEGNLIGCQFHPEKSHAPGQKLLRNFINL